MPAPPHRNPQGQADRLAKEYVGKYPDLPTKTLARLIRKEKPKAFGTLNAAQCAVRRVRGAMGEKNRRYATAPPSPRAGIPTDTGSMGPAGAVAKLPEPLEELPDYKPHRLDGTRIAALYDSHVPFHDTRALASALEWFGRMGINHLFLGGDIVDFYSVSRYRKDPEMRDFATELYRAREFLDHVRQRWPDIPITYLYGNHERRFDIYMQTNADVIAALQEFRLASVLQLGKFGIDLVPDGYYAKAGHLSLIHGDEFNQRSAVNPARSLLLKAQENVMCGHWHKTDEHTDVNPITRDRLIAAFCVGCTSGLRPRFMPLNRWNHGAALIEVDEASGDFRVENRRIMDGEVF